MTTLFPDLEPILLISIKKEHLDKIFDRTKKFELRKILPKQQFSQVYFYQTDGGGIVGRCGVQAVIHGTPAYVWSTVGEAATTKLRFDSYFSNKNSAYAISLIDPVKFDTPLPAEALKEYIPKFSVPQSYLIIRPEHPLFKILRLALPIVSHNNIQLKSPTITEIDKFIKLIEIEIGPKYPDTGREFSEFIRTIHNHGSDPNGFLSVGKQILSIYDNKKNLIGYSVLTFKRGRSIKTGPTILLPEFRKKGMGQSIRSALEDKAISLGASKLYCTCPAQDKIIVSHLLKCGYKVEAHLEKHYSDKTDEFVFAKELIDADRHPYQINRLESKPSKVCSSIPFTKSLAKELSNLLKFAALDIPMAACQRLIRGVDDDSISYSSKPRRILWLLSNTRPNGVSLLAFKRGGSVRGVLGIKTSHTPSIDKLIYASLELAIENNRKKIYFLQPMQDVKLIDRLGYHGFICEGVLRGAYKFGIDIGIYSKIIGS